MSQAASGKKLHLSLVGCVAFFNFIYLFFLTKHSSASEWFKSSYQPLPDGGAAGSQTEREDLEDQIEAA